jgi:predicted ATP-grasp superfamily ATP-dependent carboligase
MISNEMKPSAVILSLSATGLSVARSLGYRGVEVYGLDSSRWQIGHFSKYVRKSHSISFKNNTKRYLNNLINYSKSKNTRPVLFVAADDELQIVSEYAELLREHFIMPQSYAMDFTGNLLNKINLYEECRRIGVEIPVTYFPKSIMDLDSISKKVPYPAIIKPDFRHEWQKRLKGRKVIEVGSPSELLSKYEHYCRDAEEVAIQEVIPGKEENIAVFGGYFNREYEPISVFTAKKNRQYPPMFGSGSLCESHWYPEIADMSINLVKKLKYHGICGTEYKWDPRDAKWKFMEINFRPTLWFAITRASGVDIVYDAYLDLIGQDVSKKIGTQENGILWQYLVRDCISLLHYLRKRDTDSNALRQFANPRKEYAVISSKDWHVNLMYPFYILYQFLKYL